MSALFCLVSCHFPDLCKQQKKGWMDGWLVGWLDGCHFQGKRTMQESLYNITQSMLKLTVAIVVCACSFST